MNDALDQLCFDLMNRGYAVRPILSAFYADEDGYGSYAAVYRVLGAPESPIVVLYDNGKLEAYEDADMAHEEAESWCDSAYWRCRGDYYYESVYGW